MTASIYAGGSWALTITAGIVLGMSTTVAHNFFHQKRTFRRYYWDLSFFNSSDWQITHAMSHHLYTNTFNDFETTNFYPFINFYSMDKNFVHR